MNFKTAFQALALLSSPSLITGSPLSSIFPRTDPCSPGGTPILYQDYYSNQCPPTNVLLAGGSCPVNFNGLGTSCISYCEVRQYFTYDEEQPVVNNPYCYGPLACTVTTSKAFTYTYNAGGSISVTLSKVLTAGITGGLSYASATTQLQSTSINLVSGQCGYFTFLPILHTSCGSLSQGIWGNGQCNAVTTTPNVCTTQAARTADGTGVLGATIFVWTDCSNNERLPLDQQNPAYQHDGVAAPQSVINTYIETVGEESCGPTGLGPCVITTVD